MKKYIIFVIILLNCCNNVYAEEYRGKLDKTYVVKRDVFLQKYDVNQSDIKSNIKLVRIYLFKDKAWFWSSDRKRVCHNTELEAEYFKRSTVSFTYNKDTREVSVIRNKAFEDTNEEMYRVNNAPELHFHET